MPELMQCKNDGCKQVWPNPQKLEKSGGNISTMRCPKCGTEAKKLKDY